MKAEFRSPIGIFLVNADVQGCKRCGRLALLKSTLDYRSWVLYTITIWSAHKRGDDALQNAEVRKYRDPERLEL